VLARGRGAPPPAISAYPPTERKKVKAIPYLIVMMLVVTGLAAARALAGPFTRFRPSVAY
jgi:hypothetical protein